MDGLQVDEELKGLGFSNKELEEMTLLSPRTARTARSFRRQPSADVQVRMLTPPALFGEECVLDPQRGVALGSFTVSEDAKLWDSGCLRGVTGRVRNQERLLWRGEERGGATPWRPRG